MPAVRLIPKTDDAPFPYDAAKRRLAQDADLTPKDFAPMIETGRRMRWTEAMIRANEELARRSKCFDFQMRAEPNLSGSLFEDNVFFSVTGDEKAAMAYIKRLTKELGVRVFKH
jgi:hypothetical protein